MHIGALIFPTDLSIRPDRLAREMEDRGFESLWVFDHFHTVPAPTDEITFESFSVLAGLAMVTTRVRLGHMVVCTGFRNPALTAKLSSTIDVMSGGRFELGIGAGWKEDEYRGYGYDFPRPAVRIQQLEETVEIAKRQRAQDDRVEHGEDRGVGGEAGGEGDDSGEREARLPDERATDEAQITPELLHDRISSTRTG